MVGGFVRGQPQDLLDLIWAGMEITGFKSAEVSPQRQRAVGAHVMPDVTDQFDLHTELFTKLAACGGGVVFTGFNGATGETNLQRRAAYPATATDKQPTTIVPAAGDDGSVDAVSGGGCVMEHVEGIVSRKFDNGPISGNARNIC